MAKAEYGTPKYFANKMKSKGLQKLKFYCQVCNKQCRDANGFKAHVMSPSHTRNIQELGTTRREVQSKIDEYSASFESDFLALLRMTHGTKRVNANKYYQEYIGHDRDHIHLNATRFTSLAAFVFHLERTGKIVIVRDETGGAQSKSAGASLDNYYGEGLMAGENSGGSDDKDSEEYNMQNFVIKLPGDDEERDSDGKLVAKKRKRDKVEKSEEQLKMEMIQKRMESDRELLRLRELQSAKKERGKGEKGVGNDDGSGSESRDKATDGPKQPVKFSLKKSTSKNSQGDIKSKRMALGFKVSKSKPAKLEKKVSLK